MPYTRIELVCRGSEAAALEQALTDAGALSITVHDAGDQPLLEPGPGETPLWDEVRLAALFEPQRGALLAARLPAALVTQVEDEDWINSWRQHVQVRSYSGRLSVLPLDAPAPANVSAVVRLDPGLAFGTGSHATTHLCLQWLAARDLTGCRVIDYGCGSGILALAAARLGASAVIAVDHDPQALAATRANATVNGIDAAVLTVCAPDAVPAAQADVLVANILARPLIELAPVFRRSLGPGGQFALAGLLDEQAAEVMAAYSNWADIRAGAAEDGWTRLDGQCR